MTEAMKKINDRLLNHGVIIPPGTEMTKGVNILVDKLDEQRDVNADMLESFWAIMGVVDSFTLKDVGGGIAIEEIEAISKKAIHKAQGEA